jgi:hypothetical protein
MSASRPLFFRANTGLTGSAVVEAVLSDLDTENQTSLAQYARGMKSVYIRFADKEILKKQKEMAPQAVLTEGTDAEELVKPFVLSRMPTSYNEVPDALIEMIGFLMEEGPGKAGIRQNPPRFRIQPKYKQNPFLPADQDPLILFLARTRNQNNVRLQPYECHRAARLLLAHTKDSPPDFKYDQLWALIQLIEGKMQSDGTSFTPTRKEQRGPSADDYLIVLPETGVFRWVEGNKVVGMVSWNWPSKIGKDGFSLSFPMLAKIEDKSIAQVKDEIAARSGSSYCEGHVSPRGQYALYSVTTSLDTVDEWVRVLSLSDSGRSFGGRLKAAYALWSFVAQGYVQKGKDDQLAPIERKQLADYLSQHGTHSKIVEDLQSGPRGNHFDDVASVQQRIYYAAYRLLSLIRSTTTLVTAYPAGTNPKEAEQRPGEISLILPPGVMPFRLEQATSNWRLYVGSGADFANDLYFQKTTQHPPYKGLSYDVVPEWEWPEFGAGRYKSKNAKVSKAFVGGPTTIKESTVPNFENVRENRDWYISNAVGRYPFLHIAIALRAAVLSQNLPQVEDGAVNPNLIFDLTTGSSAPGIRVGAGRIDPIQVTSLTTGKTRTAEGLTPDVKRQIKHLLPGSHFKAIKTIVLPSRAGEPSKTVRKVFRPLPYQQIGIAFIHATGCRAMIADEMGLGKTIQALGALTLDPSPVTGQRMLPALVICPSSVVVNWQNETKTWLPHLSVGMWEKDGPSYDISVVSWNKAGLNYDLLLGRFQTIIIDEAHYGKRLYKTTSAAKRPTLRDILEGRFPAQSDSPYTRRTFGAVSIAQSAAHVIMLTGTPMENGGRDLDKLWTYLYTLDPIKFSDYKEFERDFLSLKGTKKKKSERFKADDTNLNDEAFQQMIEKLRELLGRYIIRRMKSTVTEQIKLGCMWLPDYNGADEGCAGSAREMISQEGSEPQVLQPEDTDILMNPRRRTRSAVPVRAHRNQGKESLQQEGGYMKMGVTKTINYMRLNINPAQESLIYAVNTNLTAVIATAEKKRRIDEVVAEVKRKGDFNLSLIERLVNTVNSPDKSKPEDIAKVALAVYHYLRTTTGRIKIQPTLDFIYKTVVKEREPLIVWFAQLSIIEAVENAIKGIAEYTTPEGERIKMEFAPFRIGGKPLNYVVVTGQSSSTEKADAVRRFQAGEVDLLLCSQALREGVTLTRACKALFVEFWWVPAWLMQAEDRIYRIGQERDAEITYLVCPPLDAERAGSSSELRADNMDSIMMSMLRRKRSMSDMVLGGEAFLTGTTTGVDLGDEEEDDEEDEGASATMKGIARSIKTLSAVITDASRDVQISVSEVIAALQENLPIEEKYALTDAGKNPKWVEETYKILVPVGDISTHLYRAGVEFNISDFYLLKFVAQHPNNQATYKDFLPLLDNKESTLDIRMQILGNKKGESADFDWKILNNTIERLVGFADAVRKRPGVLTVQANEGMFDTFDRQERGILRFMQNRLAEREAKGAQNPNSFEVNALLNSLRTYGIVSSKFSVDKLKKKMIEVFKDGKRPGKSEQSRNLVTIKKEKVVIRNGETQALRNALPGLLQHVRMAEMPELAKDLKQAMKDGNESKVVEIYRDLCDRVNEAQATGFRVPASVTTILNKVYEDLGSK